jgi:benzoylformate decarboxylase
MTSEKGINPESPTVGQIIFELWRKLGMTTIFSNPGSTEVPLLRHMPGDFDFVLGLHEASVVGMATGYALATQIPALALLHTTAGLGNAVGAIATARVNKAPLVITIGQQDRRHLINNPFLAGELKDLAGKYPLSVYEPILARDVPTLMARAWQQARSRNGPALVIVPMDDWDYLSDDPILATPLEIEPARIQTEQGVEKLIQMISNSSTPALVVGADADDPDSWRSLTELADKLNSPVFQEAFGARAGFPQDHPLFAGHLPSGRAKLREVLSDYDLILAVGAPAFRQYPFEDGPFVQRGTKIAVVGDDISVLQSSTADLAVLGAISDICSQVARIIETRFGLPPQDLKSSKTGDSSKTSGGKCVR